MTRLGNMITKTRYFFLAIMLVCISFTHVNGALADMPECQFVFCEQIQKEDITYKVQRWIAQMNSKFTSHTCYIASGQGIMSRNVQYDVDETVVSSRDILLYNVIFNGRLKAIGQFKDSSILLSNFFAYNVIFYKTVVIESNIPSHTPIIYMLGNCLVKEDIIFNGTPGIVYYKPTVCIQGTIQNGKAVMLHNL